MGNGDKEKVGVMEGFFNDNSIKKPIDVLTDLVGELESGKIKERDFVDRAKGILNERLTCTLIPMAELYAGLCDNTIGENDKLNELYSIINVACCCIDVVRQNEAIEEANINIHPMFRTMGGRPDRLLESVTELLAWAQETIFPRSSRARDDDQDDNSKRISAEGEYTAKLKAVLSGHNELNIETIKKALDTLDVHHNHNTENNKEVGK